MISLSVRKIYIKLQSNAVVCITRTFLSIQQLDHQSFFFSSIFFSIWNSALDFLFVRSFVHLHGCLICGLFCRNFFSSTLSTVEFVQSREISYSWRSGLTRVFVVPLACCTFLCVWIVSIKVSNGQLFIYFFFLLLILVMVLLKWIFFDTSHNAPGAAHIEHSAKDTNYII